VSLTAGPIIGSHCKSRLEGELIDDCIDHFYEKLIGSMLSMGVDAMASIYEPFTRTLYGAEHGCLIMISVVNGYICTSPCDVAAAKQGKDPAAHPGALPDPSNKKTSDTQPAIVFDGALKDFVGTNTAIGAGASQPALTQQKVDLLA
jgi:hypothetical protein